MLAFAAFVFTAVGVVALALLLARAFDGYHPDDDPRRPEPQQKNEE